MQNERPPSPQAELPETAHEPEGYSEHTDEAYRKRMEEEAKARQKKT